MQGKKIADVAAPGSKPVAPSFDQYAAQIRAKNPGIAEEQVKAGYAKLTGGL
jgi:hypothetical protein